uniref:Uncharacterized protein n=1 Tax=Micrurus surinamensis TaxID=129470 RepID=A0A2D4PUG0_MICSU
MAQPKIHLILDKNLLISLWFQFDEMGVFHSLPDPLRNRKKCFFLFKDPPETHLSPFVHPGAQVPEVLSPVQVLGSWHPYLHFLLKQEILYHKWLSSLFSKSSSGGAATTSGGKRFHLLIVLTLWKFSSKVASLLGYSSPIVLPAALAFAGSKWKRGQMASLGF